MKILENTVLVFQCIAPQDDDHAFNWQYTEHPSGGGDVHDPCNQNCLDSWLADGFCDATCNVQECGFDAGMLYVDRYDPMQPRTLEY